MVVVGDIFVAEWGYDQTNATFFQVVKVNPSGKSVYVREINGRETPDVDGFMTGTTVPLKNSFKGGAKLKRLRHSEHFGVVFDAGDSMGTAEKWNGKPVSVSHYA